MMNCFCPRVELPVAQIHIKMNVGPHEIHYIFFPNSVDWIPVSFFITFFLDSDLIVTYNFINQKAYLMNLHNLAARFLKFKKN